MRADGKATPWQAFGTRERSVTWLPGYDCRVKCQHEVKGAHGQHGDELRLQLRAPDAGVSLTLYTHVRDGKLTYVSSRGDILSTAGLYHHYAFRPADSEEGRETDECDLLATGRCYGDGGRYCIEDIWTPADHAAMNTVETLTRPDVSDYVLSLATGVWERLAEDLTECRLRALMPPARPT